MIKKIGIKGKMLFSIIPVMVIAMLLLTFVSATTLKTTLTDQTVETVRAQLQANSNRVDGTLEKVRNTAMNIAYSVGSTYKTTSMREYKDMLCSIIQSDQSVLGAGLWFEPYAYDPKKEFAGPYWYKDGDNIVETWDYSNAEYDYFTQDYYTNARSMSEMQATITDPYYDETSGKIMATCSAPIFDTESKKFLGCVTVDMELTHIEAMVKDIAVGKTGRAMLTTSNGTYIYTDDSKKVTDGVNIAKDPNSSLAKAGEELLKKKVGVTEFTENKKLYSLFYVSVPLVDWKLMIRMSHDEMESEVNASITKMITILVLAVLVVSAIVILMVSSIAKNLAKVKTFASALASGDFTVQKINSRSKDELGMMSESLNEMYESNSSVISKISEESGRITQASESLNGMAGQLTDQFQKIKQNISSVNDAVMASSAATEEVNASVEEVDASVQVLAEEAKASSTDAMDIASRARQIEEDSQSHRDHAITIANSRKQDLQAATAKAEVVNEISDLANSIANIAEQINLLSLNASIEAARAGEYGRGFAVVASEISKLASDTSGATVQIQETIDGVQEAFASLSQSANELLSFLEETVAPDYENFVHVGKQYGEDAHAFGRQAESISEKVGLIRDAMTEVSQAIQNIAESNQETADHSSEVQEAMNLVADVVGDVNDMSGKQEGIASSLSGIVKHFKLR
ncbi:methyl-accepting chemotaxis sensory transducer with Cache sensor [Lachnospiraceae bacterium KHCPX20]|nr:methyl-accepting chemotaxis sensory transducer with Cache sensor [Lachnospiraceae bacterium KHCPX20]